MKKPMGIEFDETFIEEWLNEAGITDPMERAAIRDELFLSADE